MNHDNSLALEVKDLTVAYGRDPVLWDLDFSLPKGKISGLIGPNGAGKSTFIKALLGLVPRAAGDVRIFGQRLERVKTKVAYMPQRASVDWDFPASVLDVVLMGTYGKLGWIKRPGRAEKELAMEALVQVGMEEYAHRQISRLSGGQQQRTFLARALAQKGDLLLMDEPFQGVDAKTEEAIITVLKDLQKQGCTLLVVHHDLKTVRSYFDHLTLLNRQVIAQGDVMEVFTRKLILQAYGALPQSFSLEGENKGFQGV